MGDENQGFARPEKKKRKFDISSPFGILVGFCHSDSGNYAWWRRNKSF